METLTTTTFNRHWIVLYDYLDGKANASDAKRALLIAKSDVKKRNKGPLPLSAQNQIDIDSWIIDTVTKRLRR